MKKGAVTLLVSVIALVLLWGCTEQGIDCDAPLIVIGERCCLDDDSNSVCDVDEAVPAVEVADTPPETVEEPAEEPTKVEEIIDEEEKEEPALQAGAESAGKKFATSFSSKQYSVMYTQFTPDIKEQKTADEFKAIMELDPFYKKLREVIYKGVTKIDDETYDLELMAKNNVQDINIPEVTLHFIDGEWKVSAFVDVFELSLFDAACSGYRYSNAYKTSDCAFDLAKKVKDTQYCDLSECHYVECRKALGATAGATQEAKQCRLCIPPMKTVNECILDIAKKYDKVNVCNTIKDSHYTDKYCFCYGGFAKYKGTSGYCNAIQNDDYKYACMKGYEGKYC